MKAFFIPFLAVLCIANFTGLAQTVRSYDVATFDQLSVKGPYSVSMRRGSILRVELSGNEEIIEKTTVKITGRTLTIEQSNTGWMNSSDQEVDVVVVFDELTAIRIGGACELRVEDEFECASLDLEISGASEMELEVTTRQLKIDLNGASELSISGSAETGSISLSGASDLDGSGLQMDECTISATGASDASIYVAETLSATASGASSVYYMGSPRNLDSNATGASTIKYRN